MANIVDLQLLEEASSSLARAQGNPSDWPNLSGFFGLTGSCIGYAVHTAERVDAWIRPGIPLPPVDHQRVEHYEKLLLLATYQSLEGKDDLGEIRRDWDPELYARIHHTYQNLIESQAKYKTTAQLPAQEASPIQNIHETLETIKDAPKEEHFIVVLSQADQSIFDSHALYLHPQSGTIVDAGTRCTWQIADKSHHCFMAVVGRYLKQRYQGQDFCIYKTKRLQAATTSLPKFSTFLSTCFHMLRHKGSLAVRYIFAHLLPVQLTHFLAPTSNDGDPQVKFYSALHKDLEKGDMKAFLERVRKREHRIWKSNRDLTYTPIPNLQPDKALLEELSQMGPFVEPVSAWLLNTFLLSIFTKHDDDTPYSAQEVEDLHAALETILRYTSLLNSKHDIYLNPVLTTIIYENDSLISLTEVLIESKAPELFHHTMRDQWHELFYILCKAGRLDLVRKVVEQGFCLYNSWNTQRCFVRGVADEFFREARTPLAAAQKAGHLEVVSYLSSLPA